MKTILESFNKNINESDEQRASLYFNDEPDVISIDTTKIKNPMKTFGDINFGYDPHGGFFFFGKAKYIKELKKAVSEYDTEYQTE